MKVHYSNVNPNKLHDELIKAGVIPVLVQNDLKEGEYIANNTWVTFADGTDMELVQKIIDAHEPTLPAQLPTEKERILALEEAILVLMG